MLRRKVFELNHEWSEWKSSKRQLDSISSTDPFTWWFSKLRELDIFYSTKEHSQCYTGFGFNPFEAYLPYLSFTDGQGILAQDMLGSFLESKKAQLVYHQEMYEIDSYIV